LADNGKLSEAIQPKLAVTGHPADTAPNLKPVERPAPQTACRDSRGALPSGETARRTPPQPNRKA